MKTGPGSTQRRRRGGSLAELAVVVAVLAALAAVVTPMCSDWMDASRQSVAETNLIAVRSAAVGSSGRSAFLTDVGGPPYAVSELFQAPSRLPPALQSYDPSCKTGWNGPYLQHLGATYAENASAGFTEAYGDPGSPTLRDPWGNPIVIQRPEFLDAVDAAEALVWAARYARVVSAGPDGILSTPLAATKENPYPARAECGDDLVLFLQVEDRRP